MKRIISGKVSFLWGKTGVYQVDYLTSAGQKILDRLRLHSQERLKMQLGQVLSFCLLTWSLVQVTPFGACCLFFFFFNQFPCFHQTLSLKDVIKVRALALLRYHFEVLIVLLLIVIGVYLMQFSSDPFCGIQGSQLRLTFRSVALFISF